MAWDRNEQGFLQRISNNQSITARKYWNFEGTRVEGLNVKLEWTKEEVFIVFQWQFTSSNSRPVADMHLMPLRLDWRDVSFVLSFLSRGIEVRTGSSCRFSSSTLRKTGDYLYTVEIELAFDMVGQVHNMAITDWRLTPSLTGLEPGVGTPAFKNIEVVIPESILVPNVLEETLLA